MLTAEHFGFFPCEVYKVEDGQGGQSRQGGKGGQVGKGGQRGQGRCGGQGRKGGQGGKGGKGWWEHFKFQHLQEKISDFSP